PPPGAPGLVIVNPPYGSRLGDASALKALHRTLGDRLKAFEGWRAAIVTSDDRLAKAAGLRFETVSEPFDHGGLSVRLYRTGPLGRV
ncbi:MAG: class I SAM-dependent RNA methyltransferase, partial [Oceanicaulis sp.]